MKSRVFTRWLGFCGRTGWKRSFARKFGGFNERGCREEFIELRHVFSGAVTVFRDGFKDILGGMQRKFAKQPRYLNSFCNLRQVILEPFCRSQIIDFVVWVHEVVQGLCNAAHLFSYEAARFFSDYRRKLAFKPCT